MLVVMGPYYSGRMYFSVCSVQTVTSELLLRFREVAAELASKGGLFHSTENQYLGGTHFCCIFLGLSKTCCLGVCLSHLATS